MLARFDAQERNFTGQGSGHETNPGFSSTTGDHTSSKKLSETVYDAQNHTILVVAGLVWDDVYAALDPLGVGVVEGRVPGVRNWLLALTAIDLHFYYRMVWLGSFSAGVCRLTT